MQKLCAIIPARYNSVRFPGKPIALLCGIPLVVHVYRKVIQFDKWHEVLVATDDDRIAIECRKYHVPHVITSSEHQDCIDRAAEVASKIDADRYIVVQGDEPFFDCSIFNDIDLSSPVINFYTQISDKNEVNDPNVVKVIVSRNLHAIYYSRHPIPYCVNTTRKSDDPFNIDKQIGVYSFSKESLMKFYELGMSYLEGLEGIGMLRFIENDIKVLMKYAQHDCLSIDTPEALQKAEKIIQNQSDVA